VTDEILWSSCKNSDTTRSVYS